jgi:dihydrodiol dehydrogenase / D-xylose 1-dehydrogenase (NADP)
MKFSLLISRSISVQSDERMRNYRWGIIAPGHIATKFAAALATQNNVICYAVASRSLDKAVQFADKYGFEKRFDDYHKMLDDPYLDVVYIASPHRLHAEQSIACLMAGKAVLCEKPMAVNKNQAQRVIEIAKAQKCFYMEAVWTRFLPIYQTIRDWLDQGLIGEVKMVQASFGFQFNASATHRLYNADLAGGATLDMGIYPITLSCWVYADAPTQIKAIGHIGDTSVDEQIVIALKYPSGGLSQLGSMISANADHAAWIYGSKGKIKIHSQFWASESATLYSDAGAVQREVHSPHQLNGYEWEIAAVHQALNEGRIEHPLMTWQASLEVMGIMDEVRSQIGLVYPFEN